MKRYIALQAPDGASPVLLIDRMAPQAARADCADLRLGAALTVANLVDALPEALRGTELHQMAEGVLDMMFSDASALLGAAYLGVER